jgi:hypothetical protein
MSTLLLVIFSSAYAQERPGVQMFVNAPEGCYVVEPVEAENIYSFIKAQIQALALAQKGERAIVRTLNSNGSSPLEDKTITDLRKDRVANACASFVVSYYSKSKVPSMAAIGQFLAYAYDELGKMDNQLLGINLQKSLRKVIGTSPQRQFVDLMDKREKLLKGMADAQNLTLLLLIDENRQNEEGKSDHLILRKAEITDILDYLSTEFPALEGKGTAPSENFTKQAALIKTFLTGSYRPAELP